MLYIWVPVYLSIFLFKMRDTFIKSYLAHFILRKADVIFTYHFMTKYMCNVGKHPERLYYLLNDCELRHIILSLTMV